MAKENNHSCALYNLWKATVLFIYLYFYVVNYCEEVTSILL